MSGQDDVSHARMAAPPCYPFDLSLLNELYRACELINCHHSIFASSDTQYYLIKYIYSIGSL